MEEKSKGKIAFWVNTKGIKLFRNKEVLSPPSWTKFRNSMSWDAVFSFFGSVLFSVLLFNSQIKKRWALFAFQESLNLKLMICIQSGTAEQIPPFLSCLFPFPPQWCQLNWLIEDHAFLFQYSRSFIPNLLMAGRGCTCDASSVWLCCVAWSSRHRGKEMQWGEKQRRGAEMLFCAFVAATHCYRVVAGWRRSSVQFLSLSSSPSLYLSHACFGSLPGSLTFRLAHLHSALAFDSTHPPPPFLFFLWFVTVRILITATCCGSSQPKLTITLNLFVSFLSGKVVYFVCL